MGDEQSPSEPRKTKEVTKLTENGNGQGGFNPVKLFFHIFDLLWEREDTETGEIDITDSDTFWIVAYVKHHNRPPCLLPRNSTYR